MFLEQFYEDAKDAGRPYNHFRAGIAPRSLLCVRKKRILFFLRNGSKGLTHEIIYFVITCQGMRDPKVELDLNISNF